MQSSCQQARWRLRSYFRNSSAVLLRIALSSFPQAALCSEVVSRESGAQWAQRRLARLQLEAGDHDAAVVRFLVPFCLILLPIAHMCVRHLFASTLGSLLLLLCVCHLTRLLLHTGTTRPFNGLHRSPAFSAPSAESATMLCFGRSGRCATRPQPSAATPL